MTSVPLDPGFGEWRARFLAEAPRFTSEFSYARSAALLQELMRSDLLPLAAMRECPERFFEAHRIMLASPGRGPGFGVRFSMQYNLFTGCVLNLGNAEQVALIQRFQQQGTLGCFCLTERLAGVNSGLVVDATATWDPARQGFVIDCPTPDTDKIWISQGLTAHKGIVIASLFLDGTNHGPHAFLIDMVDASGKHPASIEITDMGTKIEGRDLDTTEIRFKKHFVPKSTLLSRFADIVDNKYVQTTKIKMRLDLIAQMMLNGRLAIAQSALVIAEKIFTNAQNFTKNRRIWSPNPKDKLTLADLPQLRCILEKTGKDIAKLQTFAKILEEQLCANLRKGRLPSPFLAEQITAAKIRCVEGSIELCHSLRQLLGSHGLLRETDFELLEALRWCKHAEGDSAILSQKIARDHFKAFSTKGPAKDEAFRAVDAPCSNLLKAIGAVQTSRKLKPAQAWNECWREVNAVTEAAIDCHIEAALSKVAGQSRL